MTLAQLGKRAGVTSEIIRSLLPIDVKNSVGEDDLETALADSLYSGYIDANRAVLQRLHQHDGLRILPDFNYQSLSGLSHEMVERFERARPLNFGQARRIPGLTPAALSALLVHLSVRRPAA